MTDNQKRMLIFSIITIMGAFAYRLGYFDDYAGSLFAGIVLLAIDSITKS